MGKRKGPSKPSPAKRGGKKKAPGFDQGAEANRLTHEQSERMQKDAASPEAVRADHDAAVTATAVAPREVGSSDEDLKGKRPAIDLTGQVTEFHEIPGSDRLSGQRIVIECKNDALKMCEDAKHKKRLRYGLVEISFAPDDDSIDGIEIRGKIDRTDTLPEKKSVSGLTRISIRPGQPMAPAVVDKILELRRTEATVQVQAWSSYETRDMFTP